MERKKLYKAKKNWVIGLATGLAIMALGTNIAYADNNTSNEPVVTTQQANASTQQTTDQQGQVNVQPENTIGMSSNVASNPVGSYNKDNVGYANPNSEEQYYNGQQTYYLTHPKSYKYREKLLNGFAGEDYLIKNKNYGLPKVYEYLNGSENPYKNVTPEQITSIKSNIDTNITYHYLNNGVSNSIQIVDDQGDSNYEQINNLSQALSYADYKLLTKNYSQSRNDQNYGKFFDGNKVIVTPKKVLSTQDLDALYQAAYKNKPIITFDKCLYGHHITSLLQSSISTIDDGWGLTFDYGWHGYTLIDGEPIKGINPVDGQLLFTDVLNAEGKNFSWKNVVLNYFAQSLAYKKSVAEDSGQKTPYMLVGSDYLPVTDILASGGRLENPFNASPTEFIFAEDGVFVIINGAMGGYNPILVQVPMAFLNKELQAFYGVKENPPKITPPTTDVPKKDDNTKDDNTIDIGKLDNEYLEDKYGHVFKDIAMAGNETLSARTLALKLLGKDDDRALVTKIIKPFNTLAGSLTTDLTKGIGKITDDFTKFASKIGDLVPQIKKALEPLVSKFGDLGKMAKAVGPLSLAYDGGKLISDSATTGVSLKDHIKDLKKKASIRKKDFKQDRSNILKTLNSYFTVGEDILSGIPSVKLIAALTIPLVPLLALLYYKLKFEDIELKIFKLKKKK